MKKSHVYIIFADISFLLTGMLCIGYLFVDVKKSEPEKVLFEKDMEFPTLGGEPGNVYEGRQDSVEIKIPHEGGRFIVNGELVSKAEIAAALSDIKGKSITLYIDKSAPSGDTLYLYSILDSLNARVAMLHLLEGQKNVQ